MKILTGLTPSSGQLHIGNYLGCIKPLIDLATKNPLADVNLFVTSMHAFVSVKDPKAILAGTRVFLKTFVAAGADLDRFCIYDQRHIPEHAQLTWMLACQTHMGYLERMHAYKDKVANGKSNEVPVGLFLYPTLMCADILLYDATHIPVGQDQKQHVEYARDIAIKRNNEYGETFVVPEPVIGEDIGVIPGIDGRKMSKSYNNYIGLLDDDATLLKKVKQIATDMKTIEEPKDPDTCNVYHIVKHFLTPEEKISLRAQYTAGGLSYKVVKEYTYEKLSAFLTDFQKKYHGLDDAQMDMVVHRGTSIAREQAAAKMQEINTILGYTENHR